MPKMLMLLTAIDADEERRFLRVQEEARNTTGSFAPANRTLDFVEDDLERPMIEGEEPNEDEEDGEEGTEEASGSEVSLPTTNNVEPANLYTRVAIPVMGIREFYPRKQGRSGTRIVYQNGAARLVKEAFDAVAEAYAAAHE